MVHTAVAYARMKNRLQTYAVSSSVGPGATNMVTGAALATINRLPVLLLPADTFADRSASPLLQELELPYAGDVTVNDVFRPVSQVLRPDLAARAAAGRAARGDAGADRPGRDRRGDGVLPAGRAGRRRTTGRSRCSTSGSGTSPGRCRSGRSSRRPPRSSGCAKQPLIVAGGGVHYSGATEALAAFCEATGIPVGQTQAGKGTLVYDHPQCLGAIGSTGTTAANAIAREADVVIGIGTRY